MRYLEALKLQVNDDIIKEKCKKILRKEDYEMLLKRCKGKTVSHYITCATTKRNIRRTFQIMEIKQKVINNIMSKEESGNVNDRFYFNN